MIIWAGKQIPDYGVAGRGHLAAYSRRFHRQERTEVSVYRDVSIRGLNRPCQLDRV